MRQQKRGYSVFVCSRGDPCDDVADPYRGASLGETWDGEAT